MSHRWLCACLLVAGCQIDAGSSVGWRNDGTGRYPRADPPLEWAQDWNVVWATPTENWSNGTPVVWGDRIFITGESSELICLDKSNGEVLWSFTNEYEDLPPGPDKDRIARADALNRQLGEAKGELAGTDKSIEDLKASETPDPEALAKLTREHEGQTANVAALEEQLQPVARYVKPKTNPNTGYTSATPVTDGRRVCAVFGFGVAACYDMDGTRQWIRLTDWPAKPTFGHSTSPLLVDDLFIVHMNDLVALEVATGRERWRAKVPPLPGSTVLATVGKHRLIVTPSGHFVRADDGTVLAHVRPEEGDWQVVFNTPIVEGDRVWFACTMAGHAMAVKLPETIDPFEPEVLWNTTVVDKAYHYGSPLYHNGLIYTSTDKNRFSVVDAKTGTVHYSRDLEIGIAYPSIALAGEHVFVSGEGGTTIVLEPGTEYREVTRNRLEKFRSSPVFDGNRLYIRTYNNLYCIGVSAPAGSAGG